MNRRIEEAPFDAVSEKISTRLQEKGPQSELLFLSTDVDGLLYRDIPDFARIFAFGRKRGRQIDEASEKLRIPLYVNTGEADLEKTRRNVEIGMNIHPDGYIVGFGTQILDRDSLGQPVEDTSWRQLQREKTIIYRTMTLSGMLEEKIGHWGETETTNGLATVVQEVFVDTIGRQTEKPTRRNYRLHRVDSENDYLVRFRVNRMPPDRLKVFIDELQERLPSGTKVIYTEKAVLAQNSTERFTGNIVIVSDIAGKDGALYYAINKHLQESGVKNNPVRIETFGDAHADDYQAPTKANFQVQNHFAGAIKPLTLQKLQKEWTTPQLRSEDLPPILHTEGGRQAIFNVLQLLKQEGKGDTHAGQTNRIRKLFTPEWARKLLDKIPPKEWTPDDINFHGVYDVKTALDYLYNHYTDITKDTHMQLRLWLRYVTGFALDAFDGNRARLRGLSGERSKEYQDPICDRAEETYSALKFGFLLYREDKNEDNFMTALHTARNTILPTISKAYAQSLGIIVPEASPGGGSRLDRFFHFESAMYHALIGETKQAYQQIVDLSQHLLSADSFRRSKSQLYDLRTIFSRDPHTLSSEDSINKRKYFEMALLFMKLFFEADSIITQEIKTHLTKQGKDNASIERIIERYTREARDTTKNPGSAQLFSFTYHGKQAGEAVEEIRQVWHAAFPNEFQDYPELTMKEMLSKTPRT